MKLAANSYGKGRVRVMRVQRGPDRHWISELSVDVRLHGDFARAYTSADNRSVIATDTIKNIVNIAARESLAAQPEEFADLLAGRFLDRYAQIDCVVIRTRETRWSRMSISGTPHPHGFTQDANGTPTVELQRTRSAATRLSGMDGYTVLKSAGSGWEDFFTDEFTTLAPTGDRIAATSMQAAWRWAGVPQDYADSNTAILAAMLESFANTYSAGMQDSLFRMGQAALLAVPEIADIDLSCPNKHYLPVDLSRFGLSSDNAVFTPTDEPHGQIQCRVAR